jgi:nucleoid-associated protein YgaU
MKRIWLLALALVGCGGSGWIDGLLEEIVVVTPVIQATVGADPVSTPTAEESYPDQPTQTPPALPTEAVFVYVVAENNTLWGISELLYGDPERWRELYEANEWIEDPSMIYEGELLQVPNFDCERSQVAECYGSD